MQNRKLIRDLDNKWYSEAGSGIRFSDVEPEEHIQYIQGYTGILARQYGRLYPKSRMTVEKIDKIVRASRWHDIGKLAIPEWILRLK